MIPRFVQAALAGSALEIHGDGTQTRCFCHVADTVRALVALAEEPATTGEIYNVGSTESVTILELAKRVLRATESSSELVFVPYDQVYGHGIEEMFQRMPSIDKITEAVGWSPTTDLDSILVEVTQDRRLSPAGAVRETGSRPG